MRLYKYAQSILEYSILIAIIIAALVVMQTFMKRGYQGRLKDSSDRMAGGDLFSVSGSTTLENRQLLDNRHIVEETATGEAGGAVAEMADAFSGPNVHGTTDDAYAVSATTGGAMRSQTQSRMDNAAGEAYTVADYQAITNRTFENFSSGDFSGPVTDVFR